nr:DUF1648 domain-containing protein [Paludisphaera mucosa]
MKTTALALAATYGALVVAVAATYSRLPARVASHFAADGRADGWSSRPAYAAILLLGAAAVAIFCAVPVNLARVVPDEMINLPNREYWLAPERRRETLDRLSALGLAIAAATTALFLAVHLEIVRAHREDPPRLPLAEGLVLIAGYLIALGAVVYAFGFRAWRVDERS